MKFPFSEIKTQKTTSIASCKKKKKKEYEKRYFLHLYELRIFSFDKTKNKIQFAEEIEIKEFLI